MTWFDFLLFIYNTNCSGDIFLIVLIILFLKYCPRLVFKKYASSLSLKLVNLSPGFGIKELIVAVKNALIYWLIDDIFFWYFLLTKPFNSDVIGVRSSSSFFGSSSFF